MTVNSSLWNIILNIIGGILTIVFTAFIKLLIKRFYRSKFKRLFGIKDMIKPYYLVYGELKLREDLFDSNHESVKYPVIKREMDAKFGFSITPVSVAELRTTRYLTECFSSHLKFNTIISNDYDIKQKLDISFITFGGPAGNFKSQDILMNDENNLIRFDGRNITLLPLRETISYEAGYDYGIILKIHPKQFLNNSWFLCSGINEWGTSGAAWYLAKHWKKIYKVAKSGNFALVVKVRPGQDESAILIKSIYQKDLLKIDNTSKNKLTITTVNKIAPSGAFVDIETIDLSDAINNHKDK